MTKIIIINIKCEIEIILKWLNNYFFRNNNENTNYIAMC